MDFGFLIHAIMMTRFGDSSGFSFSEAHNGTHTKKRMKEITMVKKNNRLDQVVEQQKSENEKWVMVTGKRFATKMK